jgi:hypothetical protein
MHIDITTLDGIGKSDDNHDGILHFEAVVMIFVIELLVLFCNGLGYGCYGIIVMYPNSSTILEGENPQISR